MFAKKTKSSPTVDTAGASGKFVLRIPPRLHQELRKRSAREHVSLNELCSTLLAAKSDRDTEKNPVVDAIVKAFGDEVLGVILFGSRARGEARESSDWDLLIVLSDGIPLRSDLYRQWEKELASRFAENFSPHFSHLPRDPDSAGSLWFEVAIDGILLYDPRQLLLKTLRQFRSMMAEGKIQRRLSHGHPYWIRTGSPERKGA